MKAEDFRTVTYKGEAPCQVHVIGIAHTGNHYTEEVLRHYGLEPLWMHLTEEPIFGVPVVIPMRHPHDVVRSLWKRGPKIFKGNLLTRIQERAEKVVSNYKSLNIYIDAHKLDYILFKVGVDSPATLCEKLGLETDLPEPKFNTWPGASLYQERPSFPKEFVMPSALDQYIEQWGYQEAEKPTGILPQLKGYYERSVA